MPAVDTVITARWVLPIEPSAALLDWHSVVVHQGRIRAVLPRDAAREQYRAELTIERPDHLLLPGMVNAHVDLARVLLRDAHAITMGELHEADSDPEFVRTAVELAIADALHAGTTCLAAISLAPDTVAATAAAAHMRASVALPVSADPSLWAGDAGTYVHKGLELRDEYRGDPRIATFFVVPDGAHVSEQTLDRIRRNADELELPVSLNLEAPCCGADQLQEHGLLSPLLLARSPRALGTAALTTLGSQRASVLWPTDQPAASLLSESVNLALGSAATGEYGQLDLLALLRRRLTHVADGATLHASLQALTLGGAQALGLAEQIGSLVPGKWADLCCVDLARVNTRPLFDPLLQFVLHSSRDAITDVWVGGEALLANGQLTRLDSAAIGARAQTQAAIFLDR
ncbi:MAG TPA: amidohydrolase family protein [Steroidobacteraceae bacterium]|nr:amidohydrolase family protein [Steroidobacteraceae bacterium]